MLLTGLFDVIIGGKITAGRALKFCTGAADFIGCLSLRADAFMDTERKFIAMQKKSDLRFYLYYRIRQFVWKLRA